MNNDISYTTGEISQLLKISKLTVYDLIRKGDLPSYRVGKQMRVDAADLEAYKTRSKEAQAGFVKPVTELPAAMQPADSQSSLSLPSDLPSSILQPTASLTSANSVSRPAVSVNRQRSLVITGQDISLDILARHIEKKTTQYRPLRANVGSLDSLIAMYRGESDIVSTHLFDGDTGQYNLPYIRRMLIGCQYIVIHLLTREAGLYVRKGNPKGILTWSDLLKPGLSIVNRERGSGSRILLEEQLRVHGINAREIKGYDHEESNHLSVAGKVSMGEADAGIGIEKAAHIVGVDFVPLITESYDLVMLKSAENLSWIETVVGIIRSEAYRNELESIHGYDLSQIGKLLFET